MPQTMVPLPINRIIQLHAAFKITNQDMYMTTGFAVRPYLVVLNFTQSDSDNGPKAIQLVLSFEPDNHGSAEPGSGSAALKGATAGYA